MNPESIKMFENIIFLFPETDNFQEDRPRINYEDMYGWIDAYCMLFHPGNLILLQKVPHPANGTATVSANDFIITSTEVATSELARKFPLETLSGIFIRPDSRKKVFDGYKERIETPIAKLYNPIGLKYDAADIGEVIPEWKIGDFCALHREHNHLSVRFEIFSFFWRISDEIPVERYRIGSQLLNKLLQVYGFNSSQDIKENDGIFDFMSYGLNRFLIWRLAEKKNISIDFPDSLIMSAAIEWNNGGNPKEYLKQAFNILSEISELEKISKKISNMY